jgi:hypothetical protein
MRFRRAFIATVIGVISTGASAAPETWEALSTTAAAITGNVIFTPERITFQNKAFLDLVSVGTIPIFQVYGKQERGDLYKVAKPSDPSLLRGNRLCGGASPTPVTFVVVWKQKPLAGSQEERGFAAFSGNEIPTSDEKTCSTYGYQLRTRAPHMPAAIVPRR